MMKEQDELLDELSKSISCQKKIALSIGNEIEAQDELLDDLHKAVDNTDLRIKKSTKNIGRLLEKKSTKGLWMIICILFVILIVVIVLAMSI